MSNIDNSSISYTNKDFGAIYEEALDLAKTLSNEWDPSTSNESDPGVVLTKEAAFLADHINYNIDKDVLENFIQTATQDKSVRNIVELNGYTPRYYVSPTGKVSINYTLADGEEAKTFVIPALTLSISDEDETISYLQAEDIGIIFDSNSAGTSTTSSATFIQGSLETLTVNGSNVISIENLDDNYRIYMPEAMVAQNKLYVRYSSDDDHKEYGYWTRDNFMATKARGSRVFKLDYDSDKGLPYIEFPSDISNIINSGLTIKYISTAGSKGNIGANLLTKIVSPATITDSAGNEHSADNFKLTNTASITNGKDPETIDEMYESFKKIVGTFDTLVTRQDYSNRIYSLEDDYGQYYVSNAFVTDRKSDINRSCNVVSRDHSGTYVQSLSEQINKLVYDTTSIYPIDDKPTKAKGSIITCAETVSGTTEYSLWLYTGSAWKRFDSINLDEFSLIADAMNPYDLCIYALKAFSMVNYNSKVPYRALESAYTPITSTTKQLIETAIGDDKAINHNFIDASSGDAPLDVYCYKNYAPLNITITPYYKITSAIKSDIINNIYTAITENFNPRTIDWGSELSILEIKNVILDCDSRIRDVNINTISYRTAVLKTNGEEADFKTTTDYFVDNIAKNILAGRACLFTFDDRFALNYGQGSGSWTDPSGSGTTYTDGIINDVKNISTEVKFGINTDQDTSKSSYTTESTTNTNAITIASGAYAYSLTNAISGVTDSYPDITQGNSQTLTYNATTGVGGVFKLVPYDKISTATTDATEYRATADKTYEISFTGSTLTNSSVEGAFIRLTNDGNLIIKEINYKTSTTEAITNLNYTLKQNEVIQVLTPNYYSETVYSSNVYYRYVNSNNNNSIPANIDYKLSAGESIIFVWTEDGIDQQQIITAPTVIKSTFTLVPTDQAANTVKKKYKDTAGILHDYSAFKQLSSSNTISIRKIMETAIESSALKCYWYVNDNDSNELFSDTITERVLNANEFFVYTNEAMDEMVILGSGTKLTKSANDTSGTGNVWKIEKSDTTTLLENLEEDGIATSVNWRTVNLAGKPLTITEMNVISLGEGNNITISGWTNWTSAKAITNDWQDCNGTIIYTVDDTTTTLPATTSNYKLRSRLDLNASSTVPMCLTASNLNAATGLEIADPETEPAVGAVQTIVITDELGNKKTIIGEVDVARYIQSSIALNITGGDNIDLSLYSGIDIYSYITDTSLPTGYEQGAAVNTQEILLDYSTTAVGYISGTEGQTLNFAAYYSFNVSDTSKSYIIPITIEGSDVNLTAKMLDASGTEINFSDYNVSSKTTSMVLYGDSTYFLCPTITNTGKAYLKLTWAIPYGVLSESEILTVDNLRVIDGVNELITTNENITLSTILTRIKNLISNSDKPATKYFYTYDIEDGVHMNLDSYAIIDKLGTDGTPHYSTKAFDNPAIFWDPHNVANEMTIAQVDIRNSTINIASGMLGD